MDEAILFKFGKWMASPTTGVKNFLPKRPWSGTCDHFRNFKPPSIFLECVRLYCLNFASRSITASPTSRVTPAPLKGTWSGSRDHFWGKATFFKFCKCFDCGVLMFLDG